MCNLLRCRFHVFIKRTFICMACKLHDGVCWFACEEHIGRKTSSSCMKAYQIIFLVFDGAYFSTSIFCFGCNLIYPCQSSKIFQMFITVVLVSKFRQHTMIFIVDSSYIWMQWYYDTLLSFFSNNLKCILFLIQFP